MMRRNVWCEGINFESSSHFDFMAMNFEMKIKTHIL